MTENAEEAPADPRIGVLAGLAAFTLWGMFPVYFKLTEAVAPTEVLAHRVFWAVPFGALLLYVRRQWPQIRRALTHRAMLAWLGLSALVISINWMLYIWAIQNERIFETSLGYYINPLIYVLVGVLFFGERLRRLQILSVVLAATGVLVLTISGGVFPWVALSLAVSFTAYGTIRKKVVIGAMPGLFVETALLFPFAVAWLAWLFASGQASFSNSGASIMILLVLAGPVTVIPLWMFAVAARNVTLTIVGFVQFLAPTLQFMTGIYYGESLTTAHLICFGFIWVAVIVFIADALKKRPLPDIPAGA